MTHEQEIAALRAELAETKADLRRVTETLRVMCEAQAKERAAEAEAKATRRARNARHRKTSPETVVETSHETRSGRLSALPPPLDGSPPLPAPISPSPLSSPPLPFSAGSTPAAGQQALLSVPTPPPEEKPRKRATVPNAVAEWYEAAKAERAGKVPPTAPDNTALAPHQWAKLGEALKEHGQKALSVALAVFFRDEYARERHFPFGLFVSQVAKYLSEPPPKSAQPREPDAYDQMIAFQAKRKADEEARLRAGGAT